MNAYPDQGNYHQDYLDDLSSMTDVEIEPTVLHSVPRAFNIRNKLWCDACRRVFGHQDFEAQEGPCPFCRKTCRSLYNTSNLTPTPTHPQSTEYISPISRSFNLSMQNRITTTRSQQGDNNSEVFTVTFLRRTTRRVDGSLLSETVIPVIHLAPDEDRNRNTEAGQRDRSGESGNSPQRTITNHISRLVRLAHIVNRLFQSMQNITSEGEVDEADWSSQMDEGHNFSSAINSSQFPFIIFAFGNSSLSESPDLSEIIENFFSGTSSDARPPASTSAIERLPEVKYGEPNQYKVGSECSICQFDYKFGDNLVKLPCNHDYHKDCVAQWLKQHDSCPICRRSIENI